MCKGPEEGLGWVEQCEPHTQAGGPVAWTPPRGTGCPQRVQTADTAEEHGQWWGERGWGKETPQGSSWWARQGWVRAGLGMGVTKEELLIRL